MSENSAKYIKFLFEENQFCSHFLIDRDFAGSLDKDLHDAQPIAEEFWQRFDYLEDFKKTRFKTPIKALEIIEQNSPVLLNKDLASIALLRAGKFCEKREAKIASMISYDDEFPEKSFEAAFAISHWRGWNRQPSKWLHWDTFFDLIDYALKFESYEKWAAYSFIWALAQNGGEIDLKNSDYSELLWHFHELLASGLNEQDKELQVACSIALGKLRDWDKTATFSDVLNTL